MSILKSIEEALVPDYYHFSSDSFDSFDLCLVKPKSNSKYVLIAKRVRGQLDVHSEIKTARAEIRKAMGALWLLKEVGVYIVFVVDILPEIGPYDIPIDRTGFHAVIIQGIHFVSENREHLFNHSKWLDHSFGNTVSIAKRIQSLSTQ